MTSRAVAIARVICILGIVYVHAWTGLGGADLAASDHTAQGLLRWALSDLLGKAAVPLLSLVSGWLAASSLERRGGVSFVRGKVRTVLLPMVLWNAIAVALVSSAAAAGWIKGPTLSSGAWLLNELLCLFRPPDINVQSPFLRDLFVCLLLAPALNRMRGAVLLAVAAAGLAYALAGPGFPLLLRPTILVFFVLGLLARRVDAARRVGSASLPLLAAPFLALAGLEIALATHPLPHPLPFAVQTGLDLAMRAAAALVFWAASWRIAGSGFARVLLALEPYAFLLFCSHLIVMWLAGPAIGLVTGPLGSPLYPPFLLAQPALALAVSVALGRALERWSPGLAAVLTGGRLARPDDGRAMPRPQPLRPAAASEPAE